MHDHGSLFGDPRTWVGVAFVTFFVLFGRKLWAALTAILDKRGQQVRAELDEAARLRREAEALLASAKTQREAALADAQRMLEQAHAEAARLATSAREEAAQAAARREKMATDRIAAAEKAAITEVRLAAADISSRAAQQVIAAGFSAEADARLIDQAIQGLPSALGGRRAA